MTELGDAAALYAEAGWAVLPLYEVRNGRCRCGRSECGSPAKHPNARLAPNGLKDATTDLDLIGRWWAAAPQANIGLRTGEGFDVLDIDGAEGAESLAALVDTHGALPAGPESRTGGGGAHRLYAATGVGNRAGLVPKIDWRGRGGYIVAPPSVHASGASYEWIVSPGVALPTIPDWLRGLIDPPRTPRNGEVVQRPRPVLGGEAGTPYGLAAMDAELAELARASVGSRNHELNLHAFNLYQLAAGGELNMASLTNQLEALGLAIGLGALEVNQTLGSARSAAEADPRSAPEGIPPRLLVRPVAPLEAAEVDEERPKLLTVRWVPDALATPPVEPPVLVDGLMRRGELVVIGAARAVGKSWLAMNLASLLSAGAGYFMGTLQVKASASVLLSQGELDEWGSFDRWRMLSGGGLPPERVAETFDRWRIRVTNRRSSSSSRDQTQSWTETDEFVDAILDRRLEATVVAEGFDVLIVDPWIVYFDGNENSNRETEAALDKLRDLSLRLNTPVVVFAHFGKSEDVRDPEDLWRGASRLADWASTRVTLVPHYTVKQAEAMGMDRHTARRYIDVKMLRRSGAPRPDFSAAWNPTNGWWEGWRSPEEAAELARSDRVGMVEVVAALEASENGYWGSLSEAAEATGIHASTVKKLLDRAMAQGLVERATALHPRGQGFRLPGVKFDEI